ncbi:folylpolyglutamate synthase/dihydrofolate synthase family protein [Roseivirga sp. E12]|uniref:bifunctional folylpolyglutamate synthase/dihydrofolate synthase n=1 Tax=Roseivirga sp. E12 TaxID=2819237 RepID=UPI001ABCC5F7|nr:folylpolyglutamate synthase/dihydrofolate synthase family protein [Roseivirga sp. E12]MBO3697323.1 bifunctional folylpolyglutamate synthase/dihydrofolate synthase [Roseivirga sp. E12]
MNYQETLDYLFQALPMYQRVGKAAFKKDLSNTIALCEHLGNPQNGFKSIHVAGTNGKGSSSHMLASILQASGLKVGLYTSPHLKNFTERIKINGQEISRLSVIEFVESNKAVIETIQPSFFEMTVAMAFDHFAREKVDIAVIEVGLGGRLDSTNIITPEICLITNIGFDHMEMLGDTLPEIAREKAGVIKEGVPVVVSELNTETKPVFDSVAASRKAQISYADKDTSLETDLKGGYQQMNVSGVLKVIEVLGDLGWDIEEPAIKKGLLNVVRSTGLKGRWQTIGINPLTICDTGHNKDAFQYIVDQLNDQKFRELHMVLGFVNDKNIDDLIHMIPKNAHLTFCQSSVPRAMPLEVLKSKVNALNIEAEFIRDVNEAMTHARNRAEENDLIFVGGSTFVVAEIDNL